MLGFGQQTVISVSYWGTIDQKNILYFVGIKKLVEWPLSRDLAFMYSATVSVKKFE